MSKFNDPVIQKGTKVRIKNIRDMPQNFRYLSPGINDRMNSMHGETFIVDSFVTHNNILYVYYKTWMWNNQWLEIVNE